MGASVHLFTDADNTLWDTNAVYAQAQLELLRDVERATGRRVPAAADSGLAFLRSIDQRIAADHPDRLRYPPVLLVRGVSLALQGDSAELAATRAVTDASTTLAGFEDIAERFTKRLRALPPLREGVRTGLQALANAEVPITIVTEERRDRCMRIIEGHHLSSLIGDHVLSLKKTAEAFDQLRRDTPEPRVAMVGDQLDRDVRPAAMAGFEAYHFPGGFMPYWNDGARGDDAFVRISRYDAIVPYLVSHD